MGSLRSVRTDGGRPRRHREGLRARVGAGITDFRANLTVPDGADATAYLADVVGAFRRGGPGLSLEQAHALRGHQPADGAKHPVGGRVRVDHVRSARVARSWVSGSTPDSRPRPRDEDETNERVVGGVAGRKRLVQLDVRDVDEAGAFRTARLRGMIGQNGPGAPWGGTGRCGPPPTSRAAASSRCRRATPPEQQGGRQAGCAPRFVNAASASAKNIAPNFDITTSAAPARAGAPASACSNVALTIPAAAARRRASAIMGPERGRRRARPRAALARAARGCTGAATPRRARRRWS